MGTSVNIPNLTERGPFTVVQYANGQSALLVTDDPSGESPSGSDPRLTFAIGTQNTVADNEIIPAPGVGYEIVISLIMTQNETSTAQTIHLKNGGVSFLRVRAPNDGDGVALGNLALPMGNNKAVQLRPSAAAAVGYSIGYYTRAVS